MITKARTATLGSLALSLAATGAMAQDLTHSAPAQDHAVFITGGTVHTVSGETIEDGVVAFNEGRITIVGDRATVMSRISLSQDTEIIDASGKHVYPGLIAPATRLGLTEINAVRAMRDYNEVGEFTPEVRAAVSVNPDSTLIPVARSNGILLFGTFPAGGRIPGRASVMRADGWTWEDMAADDSAGMVINWPAVRPRHQRFAGDTSRKDRQKEIKKQLDELNDFFDGAEAYIDATAADESHATDLRYEAMRAFLADEDPKPVFINANDADQITSAVTWSIGRGLRPVIVGGRDALSVSDLLVTNNVPVILRGTHVFPKRTDSAYDDAYTTPARLQAAGVSWCLDSADRDGNVRNLPYEAARAAAYGLDPAVALRSITLSSAEILGIADDYGSLESGKSATLIVTDADCLEVTSNVELAFIDGKRIDISNKQTKLRDKYRDKYQQLELIEQDND
ncbi:MAG: imidazolonepropionase [Phycisphaeraceae bacterium]|nr:MAG: imidazolonepropionase [Phycisphaeraceae bacterium]